MRIQVIVILLVFVCLKYFNCHGIMWKEGINTHKRARQASRPSSFIHSSLSCLCVPLTWNLCEEMESLAGGDYSIVALWYCKCAEPCDFSNLNYFPSKCILYLHWDPLLISLPHFCLHIALCSRYMLPLKSLGGLSKKFIFNDQFPNNIHCSLSFYIWLVSGIQSFYISLKVF